ncbi:hypothetical protein COU89_00060 [Candidatus Roizmanbacteria bacterium CG10_big_fil_rev_8_21_14_0_10_45_7]|uniref:Uncharacterized protein n=1 Tax=Candidatus Roizmanbacteria bacterium CG10_big_fil_rev_8_21_14_0_10_45_7 TaxID=1974854 RepID=A0A2M8KVQ8_9BACT|nr:MAG: hypothetical protein COU89_00060 [Candidatus Roizmanbacteria bacterium CG10_big_fil_rev_8_21_14_0_10_45_7]
MGNDIVTLVLRVLSSIGYEGDKQLFAKKFIWVCEKQALDLVVKKLPKHHQSAIYGALNEKILSEQSRAYLTTVLQSESYRNTLLLVFQQNLEDYMQTVAPSLSEEQATKTAQILKEYL